MERSKLLQLPTFADQKGILNAIIEAPRGSRNKFKYDPETGLFMLHEVLAEGMVFPFDYGFLPSTLGEDGDPLDVLVLMDEPAFTGCLAPCRLIGVIEAEQTEKGQTKRNDRFVAVALESHTHWEVQELSELSPHLLDQFEHFFVSYTEMRAKLFKPLERSGSRRAQKLIEEGQALARAKSATEKKAAA